MTTNVNSLKTALRGPLLLAAALAVVCGAYAQDTKPTTPATPKQAVSQADYDTAKRLVEAIKTYKAGNVDSAQTQFEAVHTDRPNDVDAASWLGFIYLQKGRAADALPLLTFAHTARMGDLEIEANLGNAYLATGNDHEAQVMFEDIAQKQPDKASSHYNLGTVLLREKQYEAAASELRKAVAISHDDPYAYNNLGVAEDAQSNTAAAADAFEHASDLRLENATFAKNAGMTAARAGKWNDADRYLTRAHDLDKNDSKVLIALAESKLRTGNRAAARDLYEQAKGGSGTDGAFWYNLGVLRGQAGDSVGAEEAYRKALSANDSDLDTLTNLGTLLYKKGDYAGARDCFDKLSGLTQNSMAAKRNLAAACAMSGDLPRASEIWKQMLVDSPNDTATRMNLANAQWKAGDMNSAHDNYVMVVHADPNNPEALNGVGLWQLRHDDLRNAAVSFRAAISAKGNFVSAYNNLAVTLEKLNRKPEAIALLEKAQKIDPNVEEVRKNLHRMRSSS